MLHKVYALQLVPDGLAKFLARCCGRFRGLLKVFA